MKRREQTKTFMIISKKTFVIHGLHTIFSVVKVNVKFGTGGNVSIYVSLQHYISTPLSNMPKKPCNEIMMKSRFL